MFGFAFTTGRWIIAKRSMTTDDKVRKTQSSSWGFLSLEGANIRAERPTMTPMLKAFDPTTVPNGRPVSSLKIAYKEEDSSGRDVPMATRVRPMNLSLRPNFLAIEEEEFIRSSEPMSREMMPAMNRAME